MQLEGIFFPVFFSMYNITEHSIMLCKWFSWPLNKSYISKQDLTEAAGLFFFLFTIKAPLIHMPLKERKSLQQLCLQIQQRNGGVTTTGGLVATWCVTQKVGDTDHHSVYHQKRHRGRSKTCHEQLLSDSPLFCWKVRSLASNEFKSHSKHNYNPLSYVL